MLKSTQRKRGPFPKSSQKPIFIPLQDGAHSATCCDTTRHTLTQPLHTPNLIFSPQTEQVRSGLTVPLNLTSRGVHRREERRAKGLSIYLTGPGHLEDGKRWREGILAGSIQVMGVCVWGVEAMEKEIVVFDIRDKTGGRCWLKPMATGSPGWSVKYSPDGSPAAPVNTPAVMCAHGMAPFKCMRAPLAAGIKKIKGGCSFFFFF